MSPIYSAIYPFGRFHYMTCRALEFARIGDFCRSRDILYGLIPKSREDEEHLDNAWDRLNAWQDRSEKGND